jgi:hypothetical protein
MRLSEPVPVERLIQNLGAHIKANPKDEQAIYVLGRVHSFAFARGAEQIEVILKNLETGEALQVPRFPPYGTPLEKPEDGLKRRKAVALKHYAEAVQLYRNAVKLNPKEGLYRLSLAWMYEQGAEYAPDLNAPFRSRPERVSANLWREAALTEYRRAYALTQTQDAKRESVFIGRDLVISQEAGQGIQRLLSLRAQTDTEKREMAQIAEHLQKIKALPHAITPIIFPMQGRQALQNLLSPKQTVAFDLLGNGLRTHWPWVGKDTGILVWDPLRRGRITSGRQLFGTLTWNMIWRNGYEPLAALDDNRNGWLEGAELKGLACWNDRNGNGISEPGEVTPLVRLGITRVAVRPAGRIGGTLLHPAGMYRRDGSALPTYDWTPVSVGDATQPQNRPGLRRAWRS